MHEIGQCNGVRYVLNFDEHGMPVVCGDPISPVGSWDAQRFLDGDYPAEVKDRARSLLSELGFSPSAND